MQLSCLQKYLKNFNAIKYQFYARCKQSIKKRSMSKKYHVFLDIISFLRFTVGHMHLIIFHLCQFVVPKLLIKLKITINQPKHFKTH